MKDQKGKTEDVFVRFYAAQQNKFYGSCRVAPSSDIVFRHNLSFDAHYLDFVA